MKASQLLRTLRAIAHAKGRELLLVREGGNHTIYEVGPVRFPIGRHTEIPEPVALKILRAVGDAPTATEKAKEES